MRTHCIELLKERVHEVAPSADVTDIVGDANEKIGEIDALVPQRDWLSLCFADPGTGFAQRTGPLSNDGSYRTTRCCGPSDPSRRRDLARPSQEDRR
jgi:hypothetical protein